MIWTRMKIKNNIDNQRQTISNFEKSESRYNVLFNNARKMLSRLNSRLQHLKRDSKVIRTVKINKTIKQMNNTISYIKIKQELAKATE